MCAVSEGLKAGARSSGVTVALKRGPEGVPEQGPLPPRWRQGLSQTPAVSAHPSRAELSPPPRTPRPLLLALGLSSILFLLS